MRNLLFSLFCFSTIVYGQSNSQNVRPFLPEIFSEIPNVRDLSISTDHSEIYFSIQSYTPRISAIACIKKIAGKWSNPEILPFSGKYNDLEAFLSPDGLKLYFASNRPLNDTGPTKDFDIWYVTRPGKKNAWSNPINVGSPVNTPGNEFYPAITNSGNLYFTLDSEATKGKDDIFISEFKNGVYQIPESLSFSINSESYEFNAWVNPDETVLIFSGYNREDGFGSGDLYISQKVDGKWSPAKNLGAAYNSDQLDYCPFYDELNSCLYFTSRRNSLPKKFDEPQSYNALLRKLKRYDNGLSRIFKVPFSLK